MYFKRCLNSNNDLGENLHMQDHHDFGRFLEDPFQDCVDNRNKESGDKC